MTKEQQKLSGRAEKLRQAAAKAQAVADQLRARLAKIEAHLAGEPSAETGLDLLWAAAPAMARTRSSKYKCRVAYNSIPAAARPRVPALLAALHAWSRCGEWRKGDGQFIPALDRWIKERRWEDLPEDSQAPSSRYRSTPKPLPTVAPEDLATAEDLAAFAASIRPHPPARAGSCDAMTA